MKKVTMFVWNYFTNDARVMREGLTLSQYYDVKLVAIENKKDQRAPKHQTVNDHFRVERVRMNPWLLETYHAHRKTSVLSAALVSLLMVPAYQRRMYKTVGTYVALLAAGGLGITHKPLKKNVVKLVRSLRMIKTGYLDQADVYHANDLNTLTQGVICAKARLKPRQLVYDSHEVQSDRTGYNPAVVKVIERALIRYADVIFVENETRADHFKSLYGIRPQSLYNYADLIDITEVEDIDLHQMLSIPRDHKILMYQGGLQYGRGLEQLIEMMQEVRGATLVFVGDGGLRKTLEARTDQLALRDRIKFTGRVHLSELPKYTKQAYLGFQVLQNTSFNHYSAASNKLFEYIMAHVPVIGCDFPEIRSVIEREKIGLSVHADNPDAIRAAVETLLSDEALRNRMSENCRRAKRTYNWTQEESKLLAVYSALTEKEDDHV